ncbi:beta-N-acetylglucosaminidase domain-containing protein [Streptococcus mitis]|uniref:Hyaluronoglucosaminidase n=1 Tax=Streptococcus mitis TaxID=28037 RepID=A0A428CJX6_STRMT|nr:beta-N-acetylglucosaminidase domain-containing protein [Streptococcus mitis]RSI78262.1 Hyaluronoglucosaminidase precursor [Streptococcus mitis]
MDKRFFEKKSTYSIRKYAVGVCSVVIGTMLFSSQLAAAAEVTPTSPVSSASSATETDETASGAVEKIQPLDELPADLADKLAKAEAGGNDTPSTEGHEPTSEASAEATSPKPAQPKVSNEPTHPESATTAPTTEVEKTPDINHLLNVRVSASNHEQNTSFTADKAVDGDNTSRWATDKDVVNPQLTMTLDKVTSVKRIEIDWDRRQRTGQPNDPNIQGWKLYYATAEAINEEEATRKWKLAYEKDGQPVLDERVNLDVPIEAKYLKLVITKYAEGSMRWRNVGIQEIRAYSNIPEPGKVTSLNQVESLTLAQDGHSLVLPKLQGKVSLVGSNKTGVIDLNNKIHQPLTEQTVKVSLQQVHEGQTITKEFEVRVPGRYADEGVGDKPTVAPTVQQWHGEEGRSSILEDTVLSVGDSGFDKAANFYANDLISRGLELAKGDSTSAHRIEFKKVTDKGYGEEGYGITIRDNVFTIEAQTNKGAFYATRTLLQMGQENIQNGEIRDFPSFSHRGFMLDTGRKFIPYDTLVDIMLNMAYYKMNDLQLHLNDNYIFLKEHLAGKNLTKEQEIEYVLNHADTGFRLQTDIVGDNGVPLTSKQHYTKDEMQRLIALADELGINLVPEIDTPGHALSFVKVRPDLMYKGQLSPNKHNVERVAMLDLDKNYDETLRFVKSVYDKLLDGKDAPLRGVKTIHIGTDEYYGNNENYRRYVNDLITYIKGKGYTPRIWGSLSRKSGQTPVDLKDVEVDIWSLGWQHPQAALKAGAKIINITDVPTYSVPNGNNQQGAYGDYSSYEYQYNRWTPNDFTTAGNGPKLAASNPHILGGGHAVWNDNIDLHETGMTSYDIFKRFFEATRVTAEKTWGSNRAANNFAGRTLPHADYVYAPGSNPEYKIDDTETYEINPKTIKRYDAENITQSTKGLVFNKESKIENAIGNVGPSHVLKVDVTVTGDGVQELASSEGNKLYLSDESGKVAYKFEQHHIQFDKTLEKGKRYELVFVTKPQSTELYVNGEKINRVANPAHPRLAHTSLVLPLEKIGGFEGTLHNLSLSDKPFVNPRLIAQDQIARVEASSEQLPGNATEGAVSKAFDGNSATFWHSHWTKKDPSYTVTMTLKQTTAVNALTYLPRPGGGNGLVTKYEVYAKKADQLVKVAEGTWDNNAAEKIANFEAVETDTIQLKILQGVEGYASAAEINLLRPIATSDEPATPPAPKPDPKPETPAPKDDGTVELEDTFIAKKPADPSVVEAALRSQEYLKKQYKIFPTPHKVTYGDGLVRLDKKVHLVIGEQVDIYTRNRLKSILQNSNISYTTGKTAEAGATNIYLGVHQTGSKAEEAQKTESVNQGLFDKIDAYSLVVKGQQISIVGKDTDAVFYGLTTLKHMLNDSSAPVLREVNVEDYADVKNRGFIEGYYGNPWSNEDRAALMRYGGDLKLTQYFFAPKDDPYHNSKWRELYPKEKLEEIRQLAKVGNENKTRYVWTIHPFMNSRIRFQNETVYQEDLNAIKAKFTQLLDVGVREFGILADDAAQPYGGYESYNRLMKDMTDWLTEKQATYPGLKKEMIFVPSQYWGSGREDELRSLNRNLPKSSIMTLTGGKVWGEVSENFLTQLKQNIEASGQTYRPVQLWINWPCTDNSKQHLILGGGEKFLHPGVDPSLIGGVMLNPMQQSEPSKIALFSAAEYSWNIWKNEAEAKAVNDIAFNFAETGRFTETKESAAFRELGKHMINQHMDNRVVKLEESVELAPKLTNFMNKLKAGQDVSAERKELKAEFAKLKAAAETYKASGNEQMREQIKYWLDNTIDQMNALDALLTATEFIGSKNADGLWNNYYKGLKDYEQSKKHSFWYVDHYENAELGVQHIRPFILNLKEYLAKEIEKELNPDKVVTTFITNRTGGEGDLAQVLDGDLSTQVIFKNPTRISTGDYIGLQFNKPVSIKKLSFAMGAVSNPKDTFNKAKIEYLNEAGEWTALPQGNYVGNESEITLDNLDIKAKGIRMVATEDRDNTWFAVREIAVNRPLENAKKKAGSITISPNLVYKLNTTAAKMTDNSDSTEAMLASSSTANGERDTTPVDAWVQLDLGSQQTVKKIRLVQGVTDKLAAGVIEVSTDGQNWTTVANLTGEQSKEVETNQNIRYVRVRNTQKTNFWWRIGNLSVESETGTDQYTDTNVEQLKTTQVHEKLGRYEMDIPVGTTLDAGQYLGMKLERLHEIEDLKLGENANQALQLRYSPNGVEWYSASELQDHQLVRYVRLENKTGQKQVIGTTSLLLTTKEIQPISIESTSMGIDPNYGSGDVRKAKNLDQLFDGDLNNYVEFSDYPQTDGHMTLNLGATRQIKKIRAYIKDGTQNYLRDGKIQVSADGKTWKDVVSVGDGQENPARDDSLTDGWTHDSQRPGNRYIEGELPEATAAKYLRVLYTAPYRHRFVGFTELVINDGEYTKSVNNPTVEGAGTESKSSEKNNIADGNILSSYKATQDSGELIYHLSEKTESNHVRLISDIPAGSSAHVWAKTISKDGQTAWQDLGAVTTSFQTFQLANSAYLLDVKLKWEGGRPEFYEVSTYHAEIAETPNPDTPIPPVHKTTPDEGVQAPVVEQPRLDVVTEEVGFKTIERENPQLPKGTRKVVQEGKVGEKTTLVEVTIENGKEIGRVTRDSFVSKSPVAQIVEVGKPVAQVTPDEGIQSPVVEQPRLDVVTEEVGFKSIERENPQLPKGTRKVVQEGKVGEKTTLVEVTIENSKESGRVTRDSFVSKSPVDQIVEIGKPVEQVTPAAGDKELVVEQPRLDVVTEEVGFKTIERENPQLPKGTRKVVQEGKVGEKTTLVEVTIENGKESGRVTRDSFVSKSPVAQIVEIGSKEEKPSTPPVPSKPESDLRILTDKATKVQVIGTKAILDKVVSLKVKKVKAQNLEGKTYDAYDITLEGQDGQPIQPKGKVFVSLPLAANKEVEAVYTVKNAQQVDSLVFQQKGRYVEFMTDQLSVYAVVYKTSASQVQEEKPEIPSQDQTNKSASPQSQEAKPEAPLQTPERKETAVLPNTGTATDSAFLLGLLTVLTGLFLFKKREE